MERLIMKDEEINKTIGEACGWTDIRFEEGEDVDFDARSVCPWSGWTGVKPGADKEDRSFIPRYTKTLDAMHEVEKTLGDKFDTYANILEEICRRDRGNPISNGYKWHATAAQRAESFLKTLNLWKSGITIMTQ